jgi:hypothetical protein
MRSISMVTLLFLVGMAPLLMFCTKSGSNDPVDAVEKAPTYDEGRVAVGYKYNTEFSLIDDKILFKNLLTKSLLAQHPNLAAIMPTKVSAADTAAWQNIKLLVLGKETQYLVGKLSIQDTARYSVAVEVFFDPVTDSLYYEKTTEVHVCSGSTCADCDFVKTSEGRISGCQCSELGLVPSKVQRKACRHTKTEHAALNN